MDELKQLLDEAGANPVQRKEIRELFGIIDNSPSISPIAIEPTIRDNLDLSKRTVLYSEDSVAIGDYPQSQKKKQGVTSTLACWDVVEWARFDEYRPCLNRRLAMKIIHAKFLDMNAAVTRFIVEDRLSSSQHPNIFRYTRSEL